MDAKMFEVRDVGTFIPVLAIKPGGNADSETKQWLWSRAGYGSGDAQTEYVLLATINGGDGKITCDPFDWPDNRTLHIAHDYIRAHWYELNDGDVIDVAFILGESFIPKTSERIHD